MIKRFLLNFIWKYLIPTEQSEFSQEQELDIQVKIHQVPKIEEYLNALLANDLKIYYQIPEESKDGRLLRKGMMLRTSWLFNSIRSASRKINKLSERNDSTKEHI